MHSHNHHNSHGGGHHTHQHVENQMTYFIFKPLKLKRSTLTYIISSLLALSLFAERFCFITTVYKTRYYGYVLILMVTMLNCIFNFAMTRIQKKK